MRHGSLFSGIGGFDLAADWMNWENSFHCELNPFGQKILKHYWPTATSYADITKTDFSFWRGRIDVLSGGFPCQPYSNAGLRKGKADERHLWPHMLRAIREIKPRWIVGENVRGLVSWNDGMVFEEVQTDLEAAGYEVQPYILPACGVNAPHQRERVWFIANSGGYGYEHGRFNKNRSSERESESIENKRERVWGDIRRVGKQRIVANSDSSMREGRKSGRQTEKGKESIKEQFGGYDKFHRENFEKFPSQSPICDGDDGISSRLDGITFPKWRNESIKGGGNAIVPQVAFNIFKAIEQYELLSI